MPGPVKTHEPVVLVKDNPQTKMQSLVAAARADPDSELKPAFEYHDQVRESYRPYVQAEAERILGRRTNIGDTDFNTYLTKHQPWVMEARKALFEIARSIGAKWDQWKHKIIRGPKSIDQDQDSTRKPGGLNR